MKKVLRAVVLQYVQPMHDCSSTYTKRAANGSPVSVSMSTVSWLGISGPGSTVGLDDDVEEGAEVVENSASIICAFLQDGGGGDAHIVITIAGGIADGSISGIADGIADGVANAIAKQRPVVICIASADRILKKISVFQVWNEQAH